jgi:sulfite reductase beta subunit-like hemoprotein
MNEVERLKKEKGGLDVYEDILRYAKEGFASIAEDDFVRMRWYGLYQQKPNEGHFMLRIKVPGGELTSAQARVIGEIAEEYGGGICDITTRQNFQFHWLTIADVPDVLNRLNAVGISTSGACGDIARNVTGCPLAGIDPSEAFDVRPYVKQVHEYFLDNREFSDLPRKYKLSVSSCPLHCAQPEINDVSALGVRRELPNGECENGFHFKVGGGLSTRPYIAQKLNMFVPPDKIISVFHAVTEIFRDFGYRENRKRARLKFLVADWGIEKFEEEVRARLDWTPEPALDLPDPVKNFRDHVGIQAQKQEGLFAVGTVVFAGRLSGKQMLEIARIAEQYGDGTMRTTNQQNLVFSNVPEANIEAIKTELHALNLLTRASSLRRAAVACTGNEFCNLALTETKILLGEIVDYLEQTVAIDELIRINLNGCPNSCGQHHIGDIGLQGCIVKKDGDKLDGYDISLGGRLGRDAKFVRAIKRKVIASDVKYAIANLLNGYQEAKDEEEDFGDFVDRHSDDELASLIGTDFVEGAA